MIDWVVGWLIELWMRWVCEIHVMDGWMVDRLMDGFDVCAVRR